VTGVVSFASVISIAIVSKTLASPKRPPVGLLAGAPTVAVPLKKTLEAPARALVTGDPIVPMAPEPLKAIAVATAEATEVASAQEAPTGESAADPKPASSADAVALKKDTERLLNRGRMKEAADKAREAIVADPTDAMPYLYLGSALQDLGKWKDAIAAYCECVRNATKGPVNECRAVGGHK
jgi:predicted Zn-dependent protease